MNDVETRLKDLLHDRAALARDVPPLRETVRRTRVRLAAKAVAAVLSVVAVAGTGFAGVQAYVRADARDVEVANPPVDENDYAFTAEQGAYPTIASGEFRGEHWELTGRVAAGDRVDLAVSITSEGGFFGGELDVVASDDALTIGRVGGTELPEGAAIVYGAVLPSVAEVEIDVADGKGTVIDVRRFSGYDSRTTIAVDYFVAFVPEDAPGFVHARDALGIDVDTQAYGGVSEAPRAVASGKSGTTPWSVEFAAVEKDRFCLVFSASESESRCFTRREVESGDPLLFAMVVLEDVQGVAAVVSDEVHDVRLEGAGDPATLPWVQPPPEDLREWPLRLVAVGLPPGSRGTLAAYAGRGAPIATVTF